jgi:hypothetical protein
MQIASIYKFKERLIVHADSRTTTGVWMAAEPFLPLPIDSSPRDIGSAVSLVLAASLSEVPHPTNWRAASTARLSAAGVRSERSFQTGAALVTVTRNETGYVVEPHRNDGGSGDIKGFQPIPELQRSIGSQCDLEVLGSTVIEALSLCVTRPNNSFKPSPHQGGA